MADARILVATVGGVGSIRPAPGTWGSLVAACLGLVVVLLVPGAWLSWVFLALAAAALIAGLITTSAAQDHYGTLDPGQVVIDEVAGLWLALTIIPGAWLDARPLLGVVAAFALFRIMDIAKPWPVTAIERLPGTWGVMCDDLVAGVAAGAACLPIMA